MSGRKYYCYCDSNCKFETMTKEQILAAIEQAARWDTGVRVIDSVTNKGYSLYVSDGKLMMRESDGGEQNSGLDFDVDAAFITKVKETNAGGFITFWVGTQAQYSALVAAGKKDANCHYHITDSRRDADIETALNESYQLADTANILAAKAEETANSAVSTANTAKSIANSATTTAGTAKSAADAAQSAADAAQDTANKAYSKGAQAYVLAEKRLSAEVLYNGTPLKVVTIEHKSGAKRLIHVTAKENASTMCTFLIDEGYMEEYAATTNDGIWTFYCRTPYDTQVSVTMNTVADEITFQHNGTNESFAIARVVALTN